MSGPYQPPNQPQNQPQYQPQPGGPEGPPTGAVPYGQPAGPGPYGPPPGSYPGGPHQGGPAGPPPGAPGGPPSGGWNPSGAPKPPKQLPGLDRILPLVVAGLGVVIVFLSLLDAYSVRASFSFASGFGWAVALYLAAGLLALGAVLPKAGSTGFPAAAVSLSTTVALLFALFGVTGAGAGFVIILILGLLQTIAALAGYLLDAGIIKSTPKSATGGYPGPSGPGYGSPPGYAPAGPPVGYGPANQQAPAGYSPANQQPPAGYGPPPTGYPNGPQQ